MNYSIEKVLRGRRYVRVVFKKGDEIKTIDFTDKHGQYSEFKKSKKQKETYPTEWVEMYMSTEGVI